MESASIAAGAAHAHEHHGPPEAHASSKIDRQTLGILLFIVSEAMLFGAFFASYFFLREVSNPTDVWPPEDSSLPKLVGNNTAILVSSSFTVHWALEGARKGNRNAMKLGLAMTWLLGATFLFVQINEYVHIGFSARDGAFGSIFYGLTGLHGAHVFVGLLLLTFANIRAWRGHFGTAAKDHLGVEVPGIYWHFVDVMWITARNDGPLHPQRTSAGIAPVQARRGSEEEAGGECPAVESRPRTHRWHEKDLRGLCCH